MNKEISVGGAVSNYDRQAEAAAALFLQYDQQRMIEKFGLCADDEYLYLRYFNADLRIDRRSGQIAEGEGGAWKICRNYNTIMTIYDLLCLHRGDTIPAMSGDRKPIGGFVVSGVQDTGRFTAAYAARFQDHIGRLKQACTALGGVVQTPLAGADVTCLFPVTSFFSVLLQFWTGDDEFPPKITLLWDENTLEFLHFETTFFLQGDLLERLKRLL